MIVYEIQVIQGICKKSAGIRHLSTDLPIEYLKACDLWSGEIFVEHDPG